MNTPKQTVEAMRKKIEAIVRQLYLSGDHFEEEDVAVKDGTDKLLALLNPVESQGTQKRGAWNKPLEQPPSPNEAPKGEAFTMTEICPKCGKQTSTRQTTEAKEMEKMLDSKQTLTVSPLCKDCQPPAPDKEWEDAKALFFEELDYRMGISDDFIKTLDTVLEISFKPLLKAKSQEADRRVEEVIGEIETIIVTEAQNRNVGIGTSVFAFYYAIRSEIEALKKKLSLSHKEEEK